MADFDVGARMRELRQRAGFSQRQLAESAGVPHGQISMIETNKSSPSVASLRKILGGLGIGMSDFFEHDSPQPGNPFFTPAELRDLTSRLFSEREGAEGMITLKQVGDARLHNLQILHETYEPGADTGEELLEHPANEGGIVIAGELEITVGDKVSVLKAGDSFLFDSRQPHRFRNISDRPAIVVSACTPPYL
ncbi:cupin domain-containing protein [Oricola nitratireducens]|jgi:transcriptional regulator with XRE-family HTH domain|uniref:cupin domain-containing protein n=1 Tax=Oricola nitratireducens TaxID=2775868 RepID=UPI0018664503|nr:cupin domain-containing protein [Oricola nitratireducens]